MTNQDVVNNRHRTKRIGEYLQTCEIHLKIWPVRPAHIIYFFSQKKCHGSVRYNYVLRSSVKTQIPSHMSLNSLQLHNVPDPSGFMHLMRLATAVCHHFHFSNWLATLVHRSTQLENQCLLLESPPSLIARIYISCILSNSFDNHSENAKQLQDRSRSPGSVMLQMQDDGIKSVIKIH
jgi:hypothetical protein